MGSTKHSSTVAPPPYRCLRVFAFDPSLETELDTAVINTVSLKVAWEENLGHGPVGEYVEVVDIDPATGACYAPVDLTRCTCGPHPDQIWLRR